MSGESAVVIGRRGRVEIARLAGSYQTSGLRRSEFCRRHGLALSTLNRYLKKQSLQKDRGNDSVGLGSLVEVELAAAVGLIPAGNQSGSLTVLLSNGVRVEVGIGFDDGTLRRLIAVLERG
jgi:hypothetical protein